MLRVRVWLRLLIVAAVSFLLSAPAHAWDKLGHMIIAQVAYDHLTPTAKAECDRLVGVMAQDPNVIAAPDRYKPYNFVTASAWMDDMKGWDREFNTWHYIDLPIDSSRPKTPADVKAYKDDNPSNAYQALAGKCLPVLQDKAASDADKAHALGFLLHLAGDIHQPLHAAGPAAGGNRIKIVELPSADPEWPVSNLHAFWDGAYRYTVKDGAVVVAIGLADVPRTGIVPDSGPVKEIADKFSVQYPADPTAASDADPADWAIESNTIAATFAYPPADAPSPFTVDAAYAQKASQIAATRLVLAGCRMAYVLNAALDPGFQATTNK